MQRWERELARPYWLARARAIVDGAEIVRQAPALPPVPERAAPVPIIMGGAGLSALPAFTRFHVAIGFTGVACGALAMALRAAGFLCLQMPPQASAWAHFGHSVAGAGFVLCCLFFMPLTANWVRTAKAHATTSAERAQRAREEAAPAYLKARVEAQADLPGVEVALQQHAVIGGDGGVEVVRAVARHVVFEMKEDPFLVLLQLLRHTTPAGWAPPASAEGQEEEGGDDEEDGLGGEEAEEKDDDDEEDDGDEEGDEDDEMDSEEEDDGHDY